MQKNLDIQTFIISDATAYGMMSFDCLTRNF